MADEERPDAEMAEEQEAERKPARDRREAGPDDDPATVRAELERTRVALAKANKMTTEKRLRLEELEAAEEQRQRDSLSETDRLKREKADAAAKVAEAERRARDAEEALMEERLDVAIEREATKQRVDYPEIFPRLVDRKRITKDEETGRFVGVKEAVEKVLKDKPGLGSSSHGGGTPPREGPRRLAGRGGQSTPEDEFKAKVWASGNYV